MTRIRLLTKGKATADDMTQHQDVVAEFNAPVYIRSNGDVDIYIPVEYVKKLRRK